MHAVGLFAVRLDSFISTYIHTCTCVHVCRTDESHHDARNSTTSKRLTLKTLAGPLARLQQGLDGGGNALNQQMAKLMGPQMESRLAADAADLDDEETNLRADIQSQNIFLNTNLAFAYFKVGLCTAALRLRV